jgi:ribosomal 30S subunit maturation factor RimM
MLKPPFLAVRKKTITIIRKRAGSYINGRWVENSLKPQTFNIEANIQPYHLRNDTLLKQEGDRSRSALKVYTSFDLQKRQEGDKPLEGDQFVWTDGHTYEVMETYQYEMGILNHTKAIALRKELT